MKSVSIIYGSSSGNTKDVARAIESKLKGFDVSVIDVAKATVADIEKAPNLIFGTSTWGFGDLQDDWDSFLPKLAKAKLDGKTVALFGLGDGSSYADTFVDGIGIIYDTINSMPCKIIGQTSAQGYSFSESKALQNGVFVGLPLDMDNEDKQTEKRLDNWLAKITVDFQ